MMRYAISHRTTYTYETKVAYSRLVAHLAPRRTPRQKPETFALTVVPVAARCAQRQDSFGNVVDWLTIERPHRILDILAESRVEVEPAPDYGAAASYSWERAGAALEQPGDREVLDAVQYAFDTKLTALGDELVEYARASFPPDRPLLECALDLNTRIYTDFTYDKDATDTSTTVDEAFALRAGVCQDFAHVGIAAVRAMGLAARYVSGYLLTRPPPGRERLIGADASHAWFAVWIPPLGWIDFDPTNDVLPSSEHITVAWGRDYSDVAPIHGIITGGSEHEVDVAVDVMPLDVRLSR